MFASRYIGLKIITIFASCHAMGIPVSDKHLVNNLATIFEMVPSSTFSVSMFIWSLLSNS